MVATDAALCGIESLVKAMRPSQVVSGGGKLYTPRGDYRETHAEGRTHRGSIDYLDFSAYRACRPPASESLSLQLPVTVSDVFSHLERLTTKRISLFSEKLAYTGKANRKVFASHGFERSVNSIVDHL